MRIAVLNAQVPFTTGGVESQAAQLVAALRDHGHQAETISIPFRWYPPELVLDHMLASGLLNIEEANGHAIDIAIGLKFPAYLIPHPRKVLWMAHQFRQAYDLIGTNFDELGASPRGVQIGEAVRQADAACFAQARSIFVTTRTVLERLHRFNGVSAEALYHPPPDADTFYSGEYGAYLYYPSRINALKRQSLVLQALAQCRTPARVIFSGNPENQQAFQQLRDQTARLGLDGRVAWKGHVSHADKLDLYANCRAVLFTALDEDYGYVPLEAMLAAKCVIVCSDSGGGREFVTHAETGLVADPSADALADAIDRLWDAPIDAQRMGQVARAHVLSLDLNWGRVVERLLA